ncbi:hypothetical protein F4809DRAFT_605785 [Biscogniauxia mediterranea]|nr:hypothetical protein F4809DRAFT_605785 [Biscogniauxia mediterranea]
MRYTTYHLTTYLLIFSFPFSSFVLSFSAQSSLSHPHSQRCYVYLGKILDRPVAYRTSLGKHIAGGTQQKRRPARTRDGTFCLPMPRWEGF